MSDFLPKLKQLEHAASIVYETMAPTPQYAWPLLKAHLGAEIWVKHENHTPIGAFKLRGGLTYFHDLAKRKDRPLGVISASRGNHGQSVGYAARHHGMSATIVVPHGNSVEKNAAMRGLGVGLVEHGADFQAARERAMWIAQQRGLHMVPSFHPLLVQGVASYSLELLRAVPDLDVVYVPIGLGSGICGMIAARDALKLKTEIVGVVSELERSRRGDAADVFGDAQRRRGCRCSRACRRNQGARPACRTQSRSDPGRLEYGPGCLCPDSWQEVTKGSSDQVPRRALRHVRMTC